MNFCSVCQVSLEKVKLLNTDELEILWLTDKILKITMFS